MCTCNDNMDDKPLMCICQYRLWQMKKESKQSCLFIILWIQTFVILVPNNNTSSSQNFNRYWPSFFFHFLFSLNSLYIFFLSFVYSTGPFPTFVLAKFLPKLQILLLLTVKLFSIYFFLVLFYKRLKQKTNCI